MVGSFFMPPAGFGPGSQDVPEEDRLDWLPLPSGMRTFEMHIPDVDDPAAIAPALALMRGVAAACRRVAAGGEAESFDLVPLDERNRRLIAETMGMGEVSLRIPGAPGGERLGQESVFAGVWQVAGPGHDVLEVAPVPRDALAHAFRPIRPGTGAATPRGEGVVNAPPILTELADKARAHRPGDGPHVVNLTLLPHTPEDLAWLDLALGEGGVIFLSRGYGNCRVTATGHAPIWRVQFFNSMDTLILDTFEVTEMPEVVLAAQEDLADSADRIEEVLEAIQ